MEGKPVVTSKQKTEVVCGVPTQVVCTAFSSHILVVVTQFGKMGTLVSLEPSNVASDVSKPVLTTRVLLGQDEVTWLEESRRRRKNPSAARICQHRQGVSGRQPPTPKGDGVFRGLGRCEDPPAWVVLFPALGRLSSRRASVGFAMRASAYV